MSFTKLSKKRPPYNQLIKLINELDCENCKILEIGGGKLIETSLLLEKGYEVHVVDKDPESKKIANNLNNPALIFNLESIENYIFDKDKFDAVISFLTLPFIREEEFEPIILKIKHSIKSGGYIMASFFGTEDAWNGVRKNMTFISKKELINIFYEFDIIELLEDRLSAPMSNGVVKEWHIFKIFAKKK